MASLTERPTTKILSWVVTVCFLMFQVSCFLPGDVHAEGNDDLKQIEYKYYFRGNYQQAIAELRSFLQRDNLTQTEIIEAREYLAASLILSGDSDQGKMEFMQLLKMNVGYDGPDPSVFKPVIATTYQEAKAEYASMVIRTAPEMETAEAAVPVETSATDTEGKPIYKKWWFYATMAAVGLVIAGAASSGGNDTDPGNSNPATGTVTVGIEVR